MTKIRIGQGYDIHRLVPGRRLVLGGVEIQHTHGLDGHSDADVAIHALCDAILGALGEGDIGQHFPNSDPQWKNCDSTVFLSRCVDMAAKRGLGVANADITIIAEAPQLNPHFAAMRAKLCTHLGVTPDCLGLKVTTNEKLGAIGRGEGIAAFAVVLLASR